MSTSTTPSTSHPTLLLKTRSTPTDAYTTLPSPTFLPVLTHTLVPSSQSTLISLLLAPSSFTSTYGGLILTSQRAVTALGAALSAFSALTDLASTDLHAQLSQDLHPLIYVVGPATGLAVRETLSPWMSVTISGEDTGNGAALAAHILQHYSIKHDGANSDSESGDEDYLGSLTILAEAHLPASEQRGTKQVLAAREEAARKKAAEGPKPVRKPLLFLVGEQRRDVIPKTLMAASLPPAERVEVRELVVYETVEREEFAGEFKGALRETKDAPVRWVVVFSPTGCEAMLRVLGWLGSDGRFEGGKRKAGKGEGETLVASIGPTTRDFLRERFGFEVDVCAEKPSAEGVREGIEEFMAKRPSSSD